MEAPGYPKKAPRKHQEAPKRAEATWKQKLLETIGLTIEKGGTDPFA